MGLTNGTAYTFQVATTNDRGTSAFSTASGTVTPATVPGAPAILAATQGSSGGALTANANWNPPASTGGSAITGYRIKPIRMLADGVTRGSQPDRRGVEQRHRGAAVRTRAFTLPSGLYKFDVNAINALGEGPTSRSPNAVAPL